MHSKSPRFYDAYFGTVSEIQPEDAGEYFCNVQVSENVNVATAKRKIIVNGKYMLGYFPGGVGELCQYSNKNNFILIRINGKGVL